VRGYAIVEPVELPTKELQMATREVSIASSVGLHARPASLFVQAATATGLPVTIAKEGGNPVDARSILMVMALGAKHGETVTLTAEGDGAEEALDSLVALLARDLDAE
jgi:phosphocarrier protein